MIGGERAFVTDELYDRFRTNTLSAYDEAYGSWSYDASNEWVESADTGGTQSLLVGGVAFESAVYHTDVYIPSSATNTEIAGQHLLLQDAGSYYTAVVDAASDQLAFRVNSDSGFSTVDTASVTVSTDTWYSITTYRRNDGLTQIWLNDRDMAGTPDIETVDTTHTTPGQFGFRASNAKARYADLLVKPLRTRRVGDVPTGF